MVEIKWSPNGLIPMQEGILIEGIKCTVCNKKLNEAQHIFLQHRAERINIYYLCTSEKCYKKLGEYISDGKH